jgi:hypothetical protein
MLKMNTKNWLTRSAIALLVVAGFMAGMIYQDMAQPSQTAESALYDGGTNQVIQMGAPVTTDSPVYIYSTASTDGEVVDRLLWGDRVLYRGTNTTDALGNQWFAVSLSEGVSGWMIVNSTDISGGRYLNVSGVYTTPGLSVGSNVVVTAEGAGANFRTDPSVSGERVRGLQAGETLSVSAGPYQNEYFIWWQLTDAEGNTGWAVDIDGWLAVQ